MRDIFVMSVYFIIFLVATLGILIWWKPKKLTDSKGNLEIVPALFTSLAVALALIGLWWWSFGKRK